MAVGWGAAGVSAAPVSGMVIRIVCEDVSAGAGCMAAGLGAETIVGAEGDTGVGAGTGTADIGAAGLRNPFFRKSIFGGSMPP